GKGEVIENDPVITRKEVKHHLVTLCRSSDPRRLGKGLIENEQVLDRLCKMRLELGVLPLPPMRASLHWGTVASEHHEIETRCSGGYRMIRQPLRQAGSSAACNFLVICNWVGKRLILGKEENKKLSWLQLSANFWLLSNAKSSRIQEFIYWCQQESTDPNKGARTWTAVLARDQQEARETMLLSHHRSSCCKPFLGTRLLLRFLGAD
ncbi:hypothetical protein DV515_00002077, partial [Chloebia gouldiae]